MQIVKKILFLLSAQERKRAGLLLLMMLLMALIEMVGIASILPFMAVISNPSIVETNQILQNMFQVSNLFGVENNQDFMFALGVLVFIILIFSIIIKFLTTYFQLQFVLMREYSLSKRLVAGYLQQPYSWFLNRNSADLGKSILSEVSQVVGGGIKPLLDLIAQTMVAISIISLLVFSDPKLALIVGSLLCSAYGVFFYFIRSYLDKLGKERLKSNFLRFESVNEAFGASKEIKFGGFEETYVQKFSKSAKSTATTQTSAGVMSQMPRFFLEALAFGGILLIILYLMTKTGSFNNSLPIISLYVFAGYRLIPAVQQIYLSLAKLTFINPSLDKLTNDIKDLKPSYKDQDEGILYLDKVISLKNIFYDYPNSSRTALNDISLNIMAKSTVGLVGSTGSGKTTIVDIILGLLDADKGTLEVDGQVINKKNVRSWQKSIGYVPQNIYLSDDTIAANIAFGVDLKDINHEAVEKASKIANLHSFVMDELPQKYQTTVGERGVRLSGGQRQRIGIARALYHNPKVLILDEATSALDSKTERVVMDAVNSLNKHITIIIVAHRLNTIKNCDKIFLLEKGELKKEVSLEELIKVGESFDVKTSDQIK